MIVIVYPPDGSLITLNKIAETEQRTTYNWYHPSFEPVAAVSAALDQRAEIHIEMEGDKAVRVTFYCHNPVCSSPEHDFTSCIERAETIFGAATLNNVAILVAAVWISKFNL